MASSGHYCNPRIDVGPWVSVEVGDVAGFPLPASFNADAQGIAGWVPAQSVMELIESHGGFEKVVEWE